MCSQYVSEVVIGAPYEVSLDLMEHFKVDMVVHGQTPIQIQGGGEDPYAVPKRLGKFKLVDSDNTMTTERIVERIILHRLEFEARNIKKEKKEIDAYEAFQKSQQVGKV